MSLYPVKLEYIGIFLDSQAEGKLLCLIDTLEFAESDYINITDQKVKNDLRGKLGNFEDDGSQTMPSGWGGKQELQAYIYHCKDTYFYLIISVQGDMVIKRDKVQALYQELKKELTAYAKGNIGTLASNTKIKEKSL